jgi:deferrochelatase/peroxidase EfeB
VPDDPDQPQGARFDRRRMLQSAGAGILGASVLAGTPGADAGAATAPQLQPRPVVAALDAALPAVPFHGVHQAGILTPQPPAASFVSYDVTVGSPGELEDLFRQITEVARFVTTGGVPPDLGVGAPPSDSGILGPTVPPDALTVTVGVGASLFDDRFGLASRQPKHLVKMEAFPNDSLDQSQCHGDLLVQLCAGSPDTTVHAARLLAKNTVGAMEVNYRIDGFLSPPRPSGVPRNLLGFKDGIANPAVDQASVAAQLLWAGADEPAWAQGGTYHVVRIIRMFVEFWDRISIEAQENMFGRRRDNGAPLDGNGQDTVPDYAADPHGAVMPLNCHIRKANPRTQETASSQILRRGYNYDLGVDLAGNLDMGLVFNCFQQDLERQFIAVQTRLVTEPLSDYISPVGGGYFFALPGVRNQRDYYARGLFA